MNFDDVFGIHEQALKLRAYRSEVLASNLINADTPGYKARDFDFKAVLAQQSGGAERLTTTAPGHIQPEQGVVAPSELLYRSVTQASLDGNTVDAQREQVAFSRNTLEYQASLRFLNDKIAGIRRALKGE